MFFADLIVAFIVAVVLTAIFAFGFRRRGPWESILIFFIIVLMAAWAGGRWLTPMGSVVYGVYWFAFLVSGLMIALFLAAATPIRHPKTEEEVMEQTQEEQEQTETFDIFLGIFLVIMVAVVIISYLL